MNITEEQLISFVRDEIDVSKMSKKKYNQYVLEALKDCIEHEVSWNPEIENNWTHTIWLCKYPSYTCAEVACDGGESSRYWLDKRMSASEYYCMLKANPDVDYFVFRCGNKRPRYIIVEANKYAKSVAIRQEQVN